jgi:hypothetical protein
MNVANAIRTLELLRNSTLLRRYKHYNLDTNRSETCYVFRNEATAEVWTVDCIGELRAEARRLERLA